MIKKLVSNKYVNNYLQKGRLGDKMEIEQEERAIIEYIKGMTSRYYKDFDILKLYYVSDKEGISLDLEVTSYVFELGKIVTDKYKNIMNRFEFIKVETLYDVLVSSSKFKKGGKVSIYNTYEVMFKSPITKYDHDIVNYSFFPKRYIDSYEQSIRFYEIGKENLINAGVSEKISEARSTFMKEIMNKYHEEQYEVYKDFENLDLF